MDILADIKKRKAEKVAAGIHTSIPFIEVPAKLPPNPTVTTTPISVAPHTSPLDAVVENKAGAKYSLGFAVSAGPKLGDNIGPKLAITTGPKLPPTPAPNAGTNSQSIIPAGTTGHSGAVVSLADIQTLVVDEDTFNRGSEKYTQQEVSDFKLALKQIEQAFKDPKIVGNCVQYVMRMMMNNPNLNEILLPEDIGTMVRGLRESNIAHIAKAAEGKTKRGNSKKELAQLDNMLAGAGLDDFDLSKA